MQNCLWGGLREADYTAVAAQDPVGPDLLVENDVVLIVGHFRDSSERWIRLPSSDDSVCVKENLGRVEDPGEGFARHYVSLKFKTKVKAISVSFCTCILESLMIRLYFVNWYVHSKFLYLLFLVADLTL